ncbi:hypothetical protein [Paenibacillus odorifer]|uniref:hypothetical protein n=1 Tax=Paenibacillus odorifer TaxID=189426 RepID=UPI00096F15C6|nr:hypothetical protein [Paenibacillus odorifer]OMD76582.1 hypothetical protein BSK50_14900 [Paenibacillus odorifer]
MRNLIDTIFGPVLGWLTSISSRLSSLSVPMARPLNLSNYFGYFEWLGSYWMTFITTCCTLAFIYLIIYLVRTQSGLFLKFKEFIQWW